MEIAPTYAAAHAALAITYLSLSVDVLGNLSVADSTTLAERHVNRALTFDPNEARAFYARAAIADRLGNAVEALALYDRSLAINPSQSDVLQARSILLFDEMNRFDEAIEANAAAVAVDPLDHSARQDLIISLAWAGRWKEAEDHLRRLARMDPYRHARTSAYLAFAKGAFVEAVKISILSRPLYEANNDNSMALNLANLGLYKEALETTQQKNWGFYQNMEEYEQALLLLERQMAENPENESLRAAAGSLYTIAGRFAEARAVLEPLWAANKGKITLFGIINRYTAFSLLAARQETGDTAGAAEIYEKMLAFQKLLDEAGVAPNPWASNDVVLAIFLAGDEDEGFAQFEKLIKAGIHNQPLESAALARFVDDPRMIKIIANAKANRTRDRRAILEWLCGPEPPTDNLKPDPESCAEIGR